MRIEDEIKQQKFGNSAHKAVVNIIFTANWLHDRLRLAFKPFGLTEQQYNVLRILRGRYPNAANPTDIKEVMLDKNPDLTRLCDRMSNNGWIKRDIDANNRRKMNIVITEAGLNLLEQLDPIVKAAEDELAHISDKEAEKLSELLDKLRG